MKRRFDLFAFWNRAPRAVPGASSESRLPDDSPIGGVSAVTEELRRTLAAEEGGRRWLRRLALVAAFATAIGGGLVWRVNHRPPPPARFVTARVEVGDVTEKVQATGTVQPLLQVSVGAQVSGRVVDVNVDFNSFVKKGDVLAKIDQAVYGAQVNQQKANLGVQTAQLRSAEASAATARLNYERVQQLYKSNLASAADLEAVKGQYEVAQANVASAHASIAAIRAQLTQSMTNVGYTKIYSPVDGVVVTRAIDPGATVVASFQTPTLFVIAQDLSKMRVLADVDEADVGKLREGMGADAVVDAFPGETFHGIVKQIRFSPNNVQGVVTYSAVIEVDNPDEKLRPGMTATVTIKTREARGAARIPNAALRYRPTPPAGPDGKPVAREPDPPLAKGTARVYLLADERPGQEREQPRVIAVGISDGINTEVVASSLPVGSKVVTDEVDSDDKKKSKLF